MARPQDTSHRVPWNDLIWPLAVAETVVWAGFYYVFPALLPYWEAEFGWSKAALAGAFTVGLIATASAAPLAGRVVDAGHGRVMMTTATVTGAGLVASIALVTHVWHFYAIWLGLGFCMAGCLYEPCFALVTRIMGTDAKRGITVITLFAGLAGTVAFPLAYAMSDAFGWRTAVLAFGGLALGVAAPLMAYAGRGLGNVVATVPAHDPETSRRSGRLLQNPTFWFLAIAFASIAFNHGMIITHMLPILADRGMGAEAAAIAAAMVGPMQVAGRLAMMSVERHMSTVMVCGLTFIFMTIAAAALMGAEHITVLIVVFVILQGAGYGVTSITRPVVTAELLGRENFGAVSGALSMAPMGAFAVAPILAALFWAWGGYDLVIGIAFITCWVGGAALILAVRAHRKNA